MHQTKAVIDVDLLTFAEQQITIYGVETNTERAIPDFYDGMKPVGRRALWALSQLPKNQLVKSARIVGDALGKYHPHGDSSVYGALVTLATEPTPTVFGEGNWGTIFDPPAAYRYTNAKLTTYGMSAFHPVYTPVVDYVPSFDRKDKEPLVLAMLLPQLLFNGASGIGVGMRTSIPSFTPASVLQVMVSILEGEQLTAEDYASRLRFYSEYGGTPVKSKENFARAVAFFDSTKGSIEWQSKIETDEVKKTVRIVGYAPSLKMLPSDSAKTEQKERRDVVSMLRMLDSVANVSQVDGVSYCVQARRDLNVNEFRRLADKVRQMTTTRVSYEVYVTERKPVGDGKYEVAFSTLSIPQLMVKWLKRRVQLEKKSLDWRIAQVETELHKLNLQLCAADNREIIFQVLKSNAPNLEEILAKKLSISVEDAKYILDLQVRRLSGLSRSDVLEKIKDQKAKLNALKAKRKNPVGEVRDFLASAAESFAKYSVFAGTHQFDFKSVAHTTL